MSVANPDIQSRLAQLSPEKQRLLALQLGIDVTAEQAQPAKTGLAAFITTQSDVNVQAMHGQLREQLPAYMVPAKIQIVDEIPTTPNGKIDRDALLAQLVQDTPDDVAQSDFEIAGAIDDDVSIGDSAAQTEIETRLIAIWEDLLDIEIYSLDDDFFELGGYSLLAVRMLARIQEAFDIQLPAATIMEASTIRLLAEQLTTDDRVSKAIITISDTGNGIPVYLMQVNRFGLVHYQALIEELRGKHPIYGLTIPDEPQNRQITIEDSAAISAGALRQQNLKHPIVIVGLSLSGIVGYEIARLLKPDGIEVFSVMVDTQGPNYPTFKPAHTLIGKKVALVLSEYKQKPLSQWAEITAENIWVTQFRVRFQVLKRTNWVLAKLGLPLIENREAEDLRQGADYLTSLKEDYFAKDPSSDDVPVLLYRGRLQPLTAKPAPSLGWDTMIADDHLTVVDVYGPHSGLLKRPFLNKLMRHFEVWLAERS